MNLPPLLLALFSIGLSVAAQFALKAGMSSATVKAVLAQPLGWRDVVVVLSDVYVAVGFLLYGLGAIVWLKVLAQWDVSKAYPLVGLGFVAALLIGSMAGESVGATRWIGVALICLGVILVSNS